MKRVLFSALLCALIGIPICASAQKVVVPQIGNLPRIEDTSPFTWALSGFEIIKLSQPDGNRTPVMRAQVFDARTVEILSRTQSPPLRGSDVRAVSMNGREYIMVRRFLLAEVNQQDARAARTSIRSLAERWAASTRRALPQIAPRPGRFGI